MNSECVVCFNDVININNNCNICNICNNGICNSYYIHMVHRKNKH